MDKISFGIIGAGWRSQFFFRIGEELKDIFEISAVVEPNPEQAVFIRRKWNIEVLSDIEMLKTCGKRIDFLVLCLPPAILPRIAEQLTGMGYYILVETFAMDSVEELTQYYKRIEYPKRIQISEQYWLRPAQTAHFRLLDEGRIGTVTQARISIGHGYHGISLLRKYLSIGFEPCSIHGWEFKNAVVEGPGRQGYPEEERLAEEKQQLAVFTFGNKWGLFDFTEEQYFSGIRKLKLLIRGERGELDQDGIRYLKDYRTPVELPFLRVDSGKDGSMGVPGIETISAGADQVYRNPFGGIRLSDDEIAIATVLKKMGEYVRGGESFYSFEEGCQDQYLDILMKEAMQTGKTVISKPQIWQK